MTTGQTIALCLASFALGMNLEYLLYLIIYGRGKK